MDLYKNITVKTLKDELKIIKIITNPKIKKDDLIKLIEKNLIKLRMPFLRKILSSNKITFSGTKNDLVKKILLLSEPSLKIKVLTNINNAKNVITENSKKVKEIISTEQNKQKIKYTILFILFLILSKKTLTIKNFETLKLFNKELYALLLKNLKNFKELVIALNELKNNNIDKFKISIQKVFKNIDLPKDKIVLFLKNIIIYDKIGIIKQLFILILTQIREKINPSDDEQEIKEIISKIQKEKNLSQEMTIDNLEKDFQEEESYNSQNSISPRVE